MESGLDDATRDDLLQLLGHLQTELATPSGQAALLADIGLDAHLFGATTAIQDVLTSGKTGTGLEEFTIPAAATSARQFASRLVEHVISAKRVDRAITLVRRIEPRLARDERARADALMRRLEAFASPEGRAGLGWVGYHHVHK